MDREKVNFITGKIKDAVINYGEILTKYITENKVQLAAYIFPLIPPEITSAFGIESVKLPELLVSGEKILTPETPVYKAVILPDGEIPCSTLIASDLPVFWVNYPCGYGEDAAVQLHNETAAMLNSLFQIDIKGIDISELQKRTSVFETLRRSIRSITSLCQERKGILSTEELDLVFEASVIFPPDFALTLILPLLDEIRNFQPQQKEYKAKALIYGARKIPAHIIDFIENSGIDIVEDDTCRGRRLFDISLNAESEYIFYELLDAYSYRPMSPCTRRVEERYELLYKLLRNYGINLLIFYMDDLCGLTSEAISYLRIRCMRDGIDPLVIDKENYKEAVADYTGRI